MLEWYEEKLLPPLFHKCLLHSDIQQYKQEFDYIEMSEMCSNTLYKSQPHSQGQNNFKHMGVWFMDKLQY